MKLKHVSRLAATLALALAVFVPAVALAAPIPWQSVDVIAHSEADATAVLLITGTLPDSAKLPAQVELAVPADSQIQWAGEILGGDPAQDPTFEYTLTSKDGLDVYSFTLTKARRGQLEVVSSGIFSTAGEVTTSSLSWTSHIDVGSVSIFARVPATAQLVEPAEGAAIEQGTGGYNYYGRTLTDVKAGAPIALAFSFTAPAAAAAPGSPASSGDSNLVLFVVFGLVAVGGFVFIRAVNRKIKARSDLESDEISPSVSKTGDSIESADEDDEDSPSSATGRKVSPALVITGLVIAAVVAGGIVASGTSSEVQVLPDGFVQEFAQGDACNSVTLRLNEVPTKSSAKTLFEAVRAAEPLRAMAYTDDPRIEVGFCDSTTNAQAVQSALAATGLTGEIIPQSFSESAPSEATTTP